ncbi:MAG: hypothetical protein OXJ64_18965, partial [Boseongicola sp.]|nr:hypothetical protein [Boseongicola sp.]
LALGSGGGSEYGVEKARGKVTDGDDVAEHLDPVRPSVGDPEGRTARTNRQDVVAQIQPATICRRRAAQDGRFQSMPIPPLRLR